MERTITRNLFLLVSILLMTSLSYGQFVVMNNNDAGPGSLRQAVIDADAAAGPNTITFNADYTINLTTGQIVINDDLTITGTGIGNTIIDGTGNGTARLIGASNFTDLTIEGITFQNATASVDGGAVGIQNVTNAAIVDCSFDNNSTDAVSYTHLTLPTNREV